jgi:hypothetical protein
VVQELDTSDVCVRCARFADERSMNEQRWAYWPSGAGLQLYCPPCAQRAFGHSGPASRAIPPEGDAR